jgi:protocatechuate 3,4-dioxygenase beta subunit
VRIAFVVLLTSITAAAGQQPPSARTPPPARDTARSAEPTGTAIIRGTILNSDGRPLRRAQVSLVSEAFTEPKRTSTDRQGRYELTGLPAGRVTLTASRAGYLTLSYGQSRPGEAARPIELADGQEVTKVDITLMRGGVIAGRVADEAGEPLAGASVVAMQMRFRSGKRQLLPVGGGIGTTDDTGQYRVRGLEPGEYYVRAMSRDTWQSDPPTRETMAFVPTFYPGTPSSGGAQRVRVRYGQEVPGIDFGMVPGKAVSISGTATSSQGQPLAGETVNLSYEIRGETFTSIGSGASTKVNPDGSFVLRNVVPGDYALTVQFRPSAGTAEGARTHVVVGGDDLEGVQLTTQAAGALSGRVVADATAPPAFPMTRLGLRAMPVDADTSGGMLGFIPENNKVHEDGSFDAKGFLGAYRLGLMGLPDGWAIRSIDVQGRDVMTTGFDTLGQTQNDVLITITDKFPTVSGTIRDDKGNAVPSATALLFPEDSALWLDDLGTVRTARLTQSGTFTIKAVRPGEYLAVALPTVRRSEWTDPDFLEPLRERATPVTVSEGHPTTVDLAVSKIQ